MKIHYDPLYNGNDEEYYNESGYCGSLLNENYYNATNIKSDVSCKKCIKLFEKADKEMELHNEHFIKECQGFIDFVKKELK